MRARFNTLRAGAVYGFECQCDVELGEVVFGVFIVVVASAVKQVVYYSDSFVSVV